MNAIQHNLGKEKRLIELLGYSLVGPNGSNRWFIMDENKNQVGYIQYKKTRNGNVKKGHPKIFGYETEINSPTIYCKFTRELKGKELYSFCSNDYHYSFEILGIILH